MSLLPDHFRPTRVAIHLKALEKNYRTVVRRLPKNAAVLAMVKADAYGHGAVPVAQSFAEAGCRAFGVATVEEGMELRVAGIKQTILVQGGLSGSGEEAARAMRAHRLTPVVHSTSVLTLLESLAARESDGKSCDGKPWPIHLKLDTGMTRLGVTPQALPFCLETLKNSPHLKLEGVMTHLAFRFDEEFTKLQENLFREMGSAVQKVVGKIPVWHLANSAAVLRGGPMLAGVENEECWVRPGIMLYGIPPYPEYATPDLEPVMSISSKIMLIKNVPAGTPVSYNATFVTKRPSRIGVIPIGYADGLPWNAAKAAPYVLVLGKRCPILGRITMDMIMIDLTDHLEAKVGSSVTLIGREGKEILTADDWARWGETIPYEIVCRVSKRMPRDYLS